MDVALLVFLILLNGVFAMSEMALTASRKARLQVMVEAGEPGAQTAIELHEKPTKFLSTVQIGITSIGILNGIVGEAAFSEPLAVWLTATVPLLGQKAAAISATGLVVVIITFLTIIFGELVPKRLGQMYPENVARLVARPMNWLSTATRPLVVGLSACTNAVLRLMGIRGGPSRSSSTTGPSSSPRSRWRHCCTRGSSCRRTATSTRARSPSRSSTSPRTPSSPTTCATSSRSGTSRPRTSGGSAPRTSGRRWTSPTSSRRARRPACA